MFILPVEQGPGGNNGSWAAHSLQIKDNQVDFKLWIGSNAAVGGYRMSFAIVENNQIASEVTVPNSIYILSVYLSILYIHPYFILLSFISYLKPLFPTVLTPGPEAIPSICLIRQILMSMCSTLLVFFILEVSMTRKVSEWIDVFCLFIEKLKNQNFLD